MNTFELSQEEARRFLIHYQGLDTKTSISPKDAIMAYISKVGCIQYDPLNVVGRNPDLVLQSRIKNYSTSHLYELLYKERRLIDGWDKMMAIYQTSDWPYFQRIRSSRTAETVNVLNYRNSQDALSLINIVYDYIQQNGPTQSGKLSLGSTSPGAWGHQKLSSAALDYLYTSGTIGIHSKVNTQKVYDLIENLIPNPFLKSPDPFKDTIDFLKWYILRRIGSVGFLWNKNGGGWLGHFIEKKDLRQSILNLLIEEGLIIQFSIHGFQENFYMRHQDLPFLESMKVSSSEEVRFLAPLDNLLWDRTMIERLFNFNYRWEVYVPVTKRQFGYYVLPILYQDQFIGRLDPEYYRKGDTFKTKNIWYETTTLSNDAKDAITQGMKEFNDYLFASTP